MRDFYVPRWVWFLLILVPPLGVIVLFWYAGQGSKGRVASGTELIATVIGWFALFLFGFGVIALILGGPGWPLVFWGMLFGLGTTGLYILSERLADQREAAWVHRWYDVTLAPFARSPATIEALAAKGSPGVVVGAAPVFEWVRGEGVLYGSLRPGESDSILCSRWELATLLLGPPRSGKTSSVIIPSVLTTIGPVLSTSTKPDVLEATWASRATIGTCWLFDPTGTQVAPPHVRLARWTPVAAAHTWEGARRAARTMVEAAETGDLENGAHWRDGGRNLLAGLLHIAARADLGMAEVCSWLSQRSLVPAALQAATIDPDGSDLPKMSGESKEDDAKSMLRVLGEHGVIDRGAGEMLTGTASATDREASGFWSVALRAVEVYQSPAANGTGVGEWFDFEAFARSRDTVYIAASRRDQELVAPIISAFIEEVVDARLRFHREAGSPRPGTPGAAPHMLLALDEVANIAPLRTLPQLVSEGGGQGVTVLATFQDLSQARERYGDQASGFLSLFGTTMLLPGCRDKDTVDLISKLCGEYVQVTAERSRAETYKSGRKPETVQITTGENRDYRPSVPFDVVSMGIKNHAMVLTDGSVPLGWVWLVPDRKDGVWERFRHAVTDRTLYGSIDGRTTEVWAAEHPEEASVSRVPTLVLSPNDQ